jgi:hypothetical protein
MVGGDLEDFRWILEPVNFIEDEPHARMGLQKAFRVLECPPRAGKLTVQIGNVLQRLGQAGFALRQSFA